jgi:hypothetical protein
MAFLMHISFKLQSSAAPTSALVLVPKGKRSEYLRQINMVLSVQLHNIEQAHVKIHTVPRTYLRQLKEKMTYNLTHTNLNLHFLSTNSSGCSTSN